MRIKVKKLTQARKRQLAVGGIVAGSAALLIGASVYVIQGNRQKSQEQTQVQQKQQIQRTDFTSPQAGISEEALWATTEGAKVEELERRVTELSEQLKVAENKGQVSPGNGPDGLGNPDNGQIVGLGGNGGTPPPPPPPPPPGAALPPSGGRPPESTKTIMTMKVGVEDVPQQGVQNSDNGEVGGKTRLAADFKKSEEWARVNGIRPNIEVVSDGGEVVQSTVSRGKFRARDTYIPSGTFFRSVLLGGVDAPTGGDAQNASPHPVLMRVTDFAQLPNRFRLNFRECFVTGQAYGDISAERAYVRLQNLSCVGTDGRAIDVPIKGYVAGEDGKAGIRGTVVTKQGQVLANALFAGVLGGFGQGVSQAFNVTSNTAFGTTTSVGGSDQYKAGVANGIASAADRLAQYYIKLADKVFPVVEINAGRTVDVVLLRGIEIDTSDSKAAATTKGQP